jgi:hypothetical protein
VSKKSAKSQYFHEAPAAVDKNTQMNYKYQITRPQEKCYFGSGW